MNVGSPEIKLWFKMNEEAISCSQNHKDIERILRKNLEFKNIKETNFLDFFSKTATNLNELASIKIDEVNTFYEVLRIVFGAMRLASRKGNKNFTSFVKIASDMIKTNSLLVNSTDVIIEFAVTSICEDFLFTFSELLKSTNKSLATIAGIQIKFIAGLQNLFPDNLQGSAALVRTSVELDAENNSPEMEELSSKFQDLLLPQLNSRSFFADFFKGFKTPTEEGLIINLYRLVMGVLETLCENDVLLSTAMSRNDDSNFCLLLLRFMSENPQKTQLGQNRQDILIIKLTQLLLNENLQPMDYQYIGERLVRNLLSEENYWMSSVCFQLLQKYLIQTGSSSVTVKYFKLFCELFRKIANPSMTPTTYSQILIMNLLKLIVGHCPTVTEGSFDDSDFINILKQNPGNDPETRFNHSFSRLLEDPTAENYHELLIAMKMLSFVINEASSETSTNIEEIINMSQDSVHADLNIGIMELLIAITKPQQKIGLLIKFNQVLRNAPTDRLFAVELKLLEMLFSYIPFCGLTIGIPKVLTKEFNKLLIESPNKLILSVIAKQKFGQNLTDPNHVEILNYLNSQAFTTSHREELALNSNPQSV